MNGDIFSTSWLPEEYHQPYDAVLDAWSPETGPGRLIEAMRWARISPYRGVPASLFLAHLLVASEGGRLQTMLCGVRTAPGAEPWEHRKVRDLVPQRVVLMLEAQQRLVEVVREVKDTGLFEAEFWERMEPETPAPDPDGYLRSYCSAAADRMSYFDNEKAFAERNLGFGRPTWIPQAQWAAAIVREVEAHGLRLMDFALLKDWGMTPADLKVR